MPTRLQSDQFFHDIVIPEGDCDDDMPINRRIANCFTTITKDAFGTTSQFEKRLKKGHGILELSG